MKTVAIIVQNVIQWYSISPLATFLKKKSDIELDIFVYDPKQNPQDFHDIATSTRKIIENDNFKVRNEPRKTAYQICLAPYSDMITFPCKYKLGFCYGAATTKPSATLNPAFKSRFHGLFVHDIYGAELFSVYGKTYIVPDLYLDNIKTKAERAEKPVLLYLPTYNEPSVIKTAQSLDKLKKHFYIITKSHHGTDYLQDEKNKKISCQKSPTKVMARSNILGPFLKKQMLCFPTILEPSWMPFTSKYQSQLLLKI